MKRISTRDPRVEALIHKLDPAPQRLGIQLLKAIRENSDGLVETLKWGTPTWVGNQNVLYLANFPRHANLGFHRGATLAARFPEMEGTGKNLRHVKFAVTANVPARLIAAAVALDRRATETS